MAGNSSLTNTEILAAATSVLCRNDFSEAESCVLDGLDRLNHRIFEDAYSIVAVIVFNSWKELFESWVEAQGSFVELISQQLTRDEYKAWEGYLVLFTTGLVPRSDEHQIERIRYDTARIRKLVSTGSHIREVSDVEDALLPVLPLNEGMSTTSSAALDRLPDILQGNELESGAIKCLVDAFLKQELLVEAIHEYLGGK